MSWTPERQREHYLANRERILARNLEYREAHRERICEKGREYYAERRSEIVARASEWGKSNPERRRAITAAYRDRNRESIRARRRASYAADPSSARGDYAKRKGAKSCEHPSCRSIGAARLAWLTSDRRCWMCGVPVFDGANLHMDHVVPIARGGIHCSKNLKPACADCNLRKGARHLEDI